MTFPSYDHNFHKAQGKEKLKFLLAYNYRSSKTSHEKAIFRSSIISLYEFPHASVYHIQGHFPPVQHSTDFLSVV